MFNRIYGHTIQEIDVRPKYPTYAERMERARTQRIYDLEFTIIPAIERQLHKNPMARLQLAQAKRELDKLHCS